MASGGVARAEEAEVEAEAEAAEEEEAEAAALALQLDALRRRRASAKAEAESMRAALEQLKQLAGWRVGDCSGRLWSCRRPNIYSVTVKRQLFRSKLMLRAAIGTLLLHEMAYDLRDEIRAREL